MSKLTFDFTYTARGEIEIEVPGDDSTSNEETAGIAQKELEDSLSLGAPHLMNDPRIVWSGDEVEVE